MQTDGLRRAELLPSSHVHLQRRPVPASCVTTRLDAGELPLGDSSFGGQAGLSQLHKYPNTDRDFSIFTMASTVNLC